VEDRVTPAPYVVHDLAGAADEDLEPCRLRRPRRFAAQPRQIGRGRSVQSAESQEPLGPQPHWPPPGLGDEPLELVPVVASRRDDCL